MIKLFIGLLIMVPCLISVGCSSIEAFREQATIKMGFQLEGKGVHDIYETERKLINLLKKREEKGLPLEMKDKIRDEIHNLIYQMTWKQACTLYRTSTNSGLQESFLYHIVNPTYIDTPEGLKIEHPFYYGVWTREDIIKLLGMPDGISFPSGSGIYTREEVIERYGKQGNIGEGEFIYTGAGLVCDGTLTYYLEFDDAGHFACMISAP